MGLAPPSPRGFQSTLPRGERLLHLTICTNLCNFNPRSREGSDENWTNDYREIKDFNPRSREGSDCNPPDPQNGGQKISIHAPARGATVVDKLVRDRMIISIHAPARGATGDLDALKAQLNNFNPRSREGSDRRKTPAGCWEGDFNPRSREGSDYLELGSYRATAKFQSTLPRGERPGRDGCG